MQKKEFKDFIKEADNKNDKLQISCEQMKERFKRKIDDVKSQYELFKQNYLTDDIKIILDKYKRHTKRNFHLGNEWFIDFEKQRIDFRQRFNSHLDIERYISRYIESDIDRSFDKFSNIDINKIKERVLAVEKTIQMANKQITEIFDSIAQQIESGMQKELEEFNSITFDDTQPTIKKYKVTINIEEV